MVVREKNCYYAIALTDFFVFLSCAENPYKPNWLGLENPMIITHLERATQLYQALQDYQQSTHAFSQSITKWRTKS